MITVGVDLSAEPAKTVVAVLRWEQERAVVEQLWPRASDDDIVRLAGPATKIGIDCPLGWPVDFVDFVVRHHRGTVKRDEASSIPAREKLAYRRTDLVVRKMGGPAPLSVSTDRIGRAAMRAAGLLAGLGVGIGPADRTGLGRVVEVYPAAALKQWGFNPRLYKGNRNVDALKRLVDHFLARATWISISADMRRQCESSDDVFDAVVAAINARAAINKDWVSQPTDDETRSVARTEGWIAVPQCPLADLDPKDFDAGSKHDR
jgi:predicted nuclease with RNAse H fold